MNQTKVFVRHFTLLELQLPNSISLTAYVTLRSEENATVNVLPQFRNLAMSEDFCVGQNIGPMLG